MIIGKIVNTNNKGQLVIPQEYREMFGITGNMNLNIIPKSTGLFIQPITRVIPNTPTDDVYSQILEKTVGAWNDDGFDETTKKRRKIELEASDRRREEW